jgi:hypothetical protein
MENYLSNLDYKKYLDILTKSWLSIDEFNFLKSWDYEHSLNFIFYNNYYHLLKN